MPESGFVDAVERLKNVDTFSLSKETVMGRFIEGITHHKRSSATPKSVSYILQRGYNSTLIQLKQSNSAVPNLV